MQVVKFVLYGASGFETGKERGESICRGYLGRHTAKEGGTAHRASGLSEAGLRRVCPDQNLWAKVGQFRGEAVTALGPVVSLVITERVKLSVPALASPCCQPPPLGRIARL